MAAHGRLHEADPRTWERPEPPARLGMAGAERERAERQRHLERERARPPARAGSEGRPEEGRADVECAGATHWALLVPAVTRMPAVPRIPPLLFVNLGRCT